MYTVKCIVSEHRSRNVYISFAIISDIREMTDHNES